MRREKNDSFTGMKTDKVIVAQVGKLVFCCDFASLEEVVGVDRMVDRASLPEGLVSFNPAREWVSSRSAWFPVRQVMPEIPLGQPGDQLLLVRAGDRVAALRVSHVLGFEQLPSLIPTPPLVRRGSSFPVAGFRFRKERMVLELDLSRLIE
jgi:hypothetical protein